MAGGRGGPGGAIGSAWISTRVVGGGGGAGRPVGAVVQDDSSKTDRRSQALALRLVIGLSWHGPPPQLGRDGWRLGSGGSWRRRHLLPGWRRWWHELAGDGWRLRARRHRLAWRGQAGDGLAGNCSYNGGAGCGHGPRLRRILQEHFNHALGSRDDYAIVRD